MASYQVHVGVAAVLGGAYGSVAAFQWHLDWGPAFLGAGLTTVGGMMPDLDSDSGIPLRELFGLAAALTPFVLYARLISLHLSHEQILALMMGAYLLIRYGLAAAFKRFTVHRGMFHSLPAMLVAGLAVFLAYEHPDRLLRLYLAGGVVLGFLSHLVLDELYAVDFLGFRLKANKFAGSALKFRSASWEATTFTYLLLAGLGFLAWVDFGSPTVPARVVVKPAPASTPVAP